MFSGLANKSAWVITEGHAGIEVQAIALAEALGLDPVVKRIKAPFLWGWMPATVWPAPILFARLMGGKLKPPWPDILITCGRRSAALSLAIRKKSRKNWAAGTFTVHILNPQVESTGWDVVITPRHDLANLRQHRHLGPNVIATLGSLHRLDPKALAEEAEKVRERFQDLPRPLVAVLVGGPSSAYSMGPDAMETLGRQLLSLHEKTGCGLAILTSRRTGAENVAVLKSVLEGTGAYIWDGEGENPYRGLLGLADALVVTCDSVNMATEAAATGKPLYVVMFEAASDRVESFHKDLRDSGHARVFEGEIDFDWSPEPLLETPRIAAEIAACYAEARKG
ncbi:MAG TPA: mitochondrial fission ELM1 family protein [Alphaproteobacteria bacterium]|nr:mitochondrial fission ELM1 family protein [Alphaproteobacteria bacterium]